MANSLLKNHNLFEFDREFKEVKKTPLGLEIPTYTHILGTDEAGRGPGAGSVFAACVCFLDENVAKELEKLNDSKKLNEKTREELFPIICKNSIYSIKSSNIETIEKINILNASLLAMKLATQEVLEQINSQSSILLVDGNKKVKDLKIAQKTVIKGDATSASIAAASILAKVSRDRQMQELHQKFPQYNWAKNKGYLTKEHIEAIKTFGITEHHRKSFLKNILNS